MSHEFEKGFRHGRSAATHGELLPETLISAPSEEHGMPRYFFHVQNGLPSDDAEGTELRDIYAVQSNAIRLTGESLRDLSFEFWKGERWSLRVTDALGKTLFVVRVSVEGP